VVTVAQFGFISFFPGDVANAALFLASDEANFITELEL